MKALLIQPPLPSKLHLPELEEHRLQFVPLNLGYLAAVMEQMRIEVQILDLNVLGVLEEDFGATYLKNNYHFDIVGITSTTISYKPAISIAKQIKDFMPSTLVLMGGSHVTFTDQDTLHNVPEVDIVVRGEAEETIINLVEAIKNRDSFLKVPGISFRINGQVFRNQDVKPIRNLDSLPFPARHLLPMKKYKGPAIVASRGCTQQCIFCSAGAMSGGVYRVRSAENIVNELKTFSMLENVAFYDNTFSGNMKRSIEICKAILNASLDMTWSCELRVDNCSKELLEIMFKAGCRKLQFGVESGHPSILNDIKKKITKEQVRKAVSRALEAGFEVYCSFTFGHPGDNQESLQATSEFMTEIKAMGAEANAGIITPYPGTPIYENADQYGITIHDRQWEKYHPTRCSISTKYLAKQEIAQHYMKTLIALNRDKLVTS